jgi:hypothetical protein
MSGWPGAAGGPRRLRRGPRELQAGAGALLALLLAPLLAPLLTTTPPRPAAPAAPAQVLALRAKMFGTGHLTYADTLFTIGAVLRKQGGQDKQAEAAMKKAIAIIEDSGARLRPAFADGRACLCRLIGRAACRCGLWADLPLPLAPVPAGRPPRPPAPQAPPPAPPCCTGTWSWRTCRRGR